MLPIISKQFGAKLGVDLAAMQKKLDEVRKFADDQLEYIQKLHRKVNVDLKIFLEEQSC